MSNQLVSNLTVDELKNLIASVVDNKLNNFLHFLGADVVKTSPDTENYPHIQDFSSESFLLYRSYLEKVIEAQNKIKQVENLLDSSPNINQDNPWLKIAGMHKHNPLFEEVVASIQSNHQEYSDEELS
jgi:hypothetical protein